MVVLAEKKIEKQSHKLQLIIYEDFLSITVMMNMDDYVELIPYGIEYERLGLHRLVTSIFNTKYEGLKIFYQEQDYINWYNLINTNTINNSNGAWAKTVIIDLSQNDFEESLNSALNYVISKSNEYDKRIPLDKAEIAKNVLKRF